MNLSLLQTFRNRPPFTMGDASPTEIGRQIAETYAAFDEDQPAAEDIWRTVYTTLGLGDKSPFFKSGLKLARALDEGHGTGIIGGYHDAKHYIQVLLNTAYLMRRNNLIHDEVFLETDDQEKLLFAALAHDYFYEPGGNKNPDGTPHPYRLEKIAIKNALRFLKNAGSEDVGDILLMILGTDVSPASKAGTFVRSAYRYVFEHRDQDRRERPQLTEALKPLETLLFEPKLLHMTALLGDADMLSSAGLSAAYHRVLSDRLGRELGVTLAAQSTVDFCNNILENRFIIRAARFFEPVMEDIKAAADRALMKPAAIEFRGCDL